MYVNVYKLFLAIYRIIILNDIEVQMKKECKIVDATIGAYGRADVPELVGAFRLHQLSQWTMIYIEMTE